MCLSFRGSLSLCLVGVLKLIGSTGFRSWWLSLWEEGRAAGDNEVKQWNVLGWGLRFWSEFIGCYPVIIACYWTLWYLSTLDRICYNAFYRICKELDKCFLLAIINLAGVHLHQKSGRLVFCGMGMLSFSDVWVHLFCWLYKYQRTKCQGQCLTLLPDWGLDMRYKISESTKQALKEFLRRDSAHSFCGLVGLPEGLCVPARVIA